MGVKERRRARRRRPEPIPPIPTFPHAGGRSVKKAECRCREEGTSFGLLVGAKHVLVRACGRGNVTGACAGHHDEPIAPSPREGWQHSGCPWPRLCRGARAPPGDLNGDVMLVASGDRTLGDRTQADGTLDSPACDHGDAYAVPGLATLTPAHPLAGLDALARQVAAAGVMRGRGDVILYDRLGEPCHVGPRPLTPIVSTII